MPDLKAIDWLTKTRSDTREAYRLGMPVAELRRRRKAEREAIAESASTAYRASLLRALRAREAE